MIPTAFKVSLGGSSAEPVPVKITVGSGVLFIAIGFMLIIAMRKAKK